MQWKNNDVVGFKRVFVGFVPLLNSFDKNNCTNLITTRSLLKQKHLQQDFVGFETTFFEKKVFSNSFKKTFIFWGAFFRFLAAEIRKKAPQTPKERKRLGFGYLFVFNLQAVQTALLARLHYRLNFTFIGGQARSGGLRQWKDYKKPD